jgi:hypothetical protein
VASPTLSRSLKNVTMKKTVHATICALTMLVLRGLTPVSAAPTQPCTFEDLMPAYDKFAQATAGVAPAQRAAAFVTTVASRYPDYYAPEVFGDDTKLHARALRFFYPAQRAAALPGTPPLTKERLAAMGKVVGPQFAEQQRRFMQTFTDFSCETTVEFGVSLLRFDGHPADFSGKKHLLFGVDSIALLHVPADMPAFFDHEIFHLYHRQVIGSRAPQGDEPAWWTMWVEGLATYVSQRMHPGLAAQQVLWYPKDMVVRIQQDPARAATLLLRDIDKTGNEADRWFLANEEVEGLPARAGYYLGYLLPAPRPALVTAAAGAPGTCTGTSGRGEIPDRARATRARAIAAVKCVARGQLGLQGARSARVLRQRETTAGG